MVGPAEKWRRVVKRYDLPVRRAIGSRDVVCNTRTLVNAAG